MIVYYATILFLTSESIYTTGELVDAKTVLLELGSNFVVEVTPVKGIEMLKKKQNALLKSRTQFNDVLVVK
ncbi:prefoldin alpha-like protein, partial [Kipferlia bialata]|eukprot:g15238.t1